MKGINNNDNYRASFELSVLELGISKNNKFKQILDQTQANPDDISGLGLTWGQTLALNAIQKLLHETDYQGHHLSREMETSLGYIRCPILYITIPQYLEAYGLERSSQNRFNRNQRDSAIKNLESLSEQRKIFFSKGFFKKGKGKKEGKWINQIVETDKKLISLTRLYELPQELTGKTSKKEIRKRYKFFQIGVSPLLFFDIECKFILKPYGLFKAIEMELNNKNNKGSKSCYDFILMLLQSDLERYVIKKENLALKLELKYLLNSRQKSRLDQEIDRIIDIALKLEFLRSFSFDENSDNFTFILNPDKCSRLRRKTIISENKTKTESLPLDEIMELQDAWELTEDF